MRDLWTAICDLRPAKPAFLPEHYPDLTGRTALITGTSAGIGKETTRLLLLQNATVVVFNRNPEKTERAVSEIKSAVVAERPDLESVVDARILPVYGDLSDLTTIKPAVDQIFAKVKQLDIVVFNAGVMQPPNGSVSQQGYELQFGTNVIGHQLLLKLINPLILKSLKTGFTPRVIFLSSSAHLLAPRPGGIDFSLGFKDASISSTLKSYGQSKAANIYQAQIYGEDNPDVVSLSVHPGYLVSELGRSQPAFLQKILPRFLYPAVYGSYSELFGALSPEISTKDNGRYIGPWGQFREVRPDIKEGFTDGTARKLWDYVEGEISKYAF
jgi:protochlorophyllide reductase